MLSPEALRLVHTRLAGYSLFFQLLELQRCLAIEARGLDFAGQFNLLACSRFGFEQRLVVGKSVVPCSAIYGGSGFSCPGRRGQRQVLPLSRLVEAPPAFAGGTTRTRLNSWSSCLALDLFAARQQSSQAIHPLNTGRGGGCQNKNPSAQCRG